MVTTIRDVVLPDGTPAKEYEKLYGASETQPIYTYYDADVNEIDTSKYELDYWFRIKGLTFREAS